MLSLGIKIKIRKRFLALNRLKAAMVGLLVFGLNQNLLLFLGGSRHKEEPVSMSVTCACDPSACMCPPSSGCHHHQQQSKPEAKNGLKKKQITACRPISTDQGLTPIFFGFEVPILTQHLDGFSPNRSYTYLFRLSHFLFTQYYLTPPDKPPQISFT